MGRLIKANVDRLDLSERVLAGWSEMAALGATPPEYLRLIESEIAILMGMAGDDERRADLTERYQALAECLRQNIN